MLLKTERAVFMIPLAVTAIFQNEASYLKEWIEFHRLIGFEFFYLFDHGSSDEPETVLKPYIDSRVVKLEKWPLEYSNVYEWTEVQCLAYERAIYWAKQKVRWLAVLDVDEFLVPVEKSLLEILKDFEPFGGVAVNWQIFGTSFVKEIDREERLIEKLIYKALPMQVGNRHIKSIVRPERVKGCLSAHTMEYEDGFFQVNTKKIPFEGSLSPTIEIDLLKVHHYTLRDEDYFENVKKKRLKKWWPKEAENWEEKSKSMNAVKDTTMHYFLKGLNQLMR